MFDRLRARPAPRDESPPGPKGPQEGDRYDGPAAYCADYGLVPRPGYYALSEGGKTLDAGLRLVYVDDAPGDHLDGSGHYEVASESDPIAKQGTIVALEAHSEGNAGVIA